MKAHSSHHPPLTGSLSDSTLTSPLSEPLPSAMPSAPFRSVIGGAVQVSAECYKEHGPPSRSAEPGLPVPGFVFLPAF